jgi:glucose dehydrogenase
MGRILKRQARVPALLLFAFALHAQTDWPVFGHDPGGMRYSPLKQINAGNVNQLQIAWQFNTEAVVGAGQATASTRRPRRRMSESTPLVVDGVLFMSTGYNRVVALEPETGKKLWEYESQHPPAMRGIAYWAGTKDLPPQIVFGTGDGWLISLNAKTGKPVPGFGVEGVVNLRNGVGDQFPKQRIGMSSPPSIYKDLVITGSTMGETPSHGPSGDIRAWDMHTGKLVWTFHTIPRPGEANHDAWQDGQWEDRSGADAWGFITVRSGRHPEQRFLWRRPERLQSLWRVHCGAGCRDRSAEMVFSNYPSRQLGL